jgi:protein MpaA
MLLRFKMRLVLCLLLVTGSIVTVTSLVVTDPALASGCSISITLRQGSRASDVWCLESTLRARGYSGVIGPNAFFGPSTRIAVVQFQRSAGLSPDGIVGPLTATALGILRDPTATIPAKVIETRVIGTSVQGRDITAYRMGTPGGRVVLVVGVTHGDENKGALITADLRTLPTPPGIDLWIIDSINPDGLAAGTRQNANGVDLNRNFETGWNYIAPGAHGQYSGQAAADQPESQAVEAFIRLIKPSIGVWYHQDAHIVGVGGFNREIPKRYSTLVGLGTGGVPCSQMCTGTATKFANTAVQHSTNFLVELPGSDQVTAAMMLVHAQAVLAVITM